MIRILFALLVTLAAFSVAALWKARGGDVRRLDTDLVAAEVRAALGSKLRDLARATGSSTTPESAAANTATAAEAVADATPERPAPIRPSVPTPAEPVVVEEIHAREEFVPAAGDAAGSTPNGGGEPSDLTPDGFGDFEQTTRDHDASAALIRRMLAVYRQASPPR